LGRPTDAASCFGGAHHERVDGQSVDVYRSLTGTA
jgi:hypothetical protein